MAVFVITSLLILLTTVAASSRSESSGAAASAAVVDETRYNAGHHETVGERQGRQAAPEHCRSARRAVPWYRFWTHSWQTARQARRLASGMNIRGHSCSYARFASREWRARAVKARMLYEAWSYEWEWQRWLPAKWARIGACETGYGRRPGNWGWDSGTYVSFAGIIRGGYNDFAQRLGLPTWDAPGVRTPREQYRVARALQAEHGYGAWGCGGA